MPGLKEKEQEAIWDRLKLSDNDELSIFIEETIGIVIYNKKITNGFIDDFRTEVHRKNNYAFNSTKIKTVDHLKNVIALNCWQAGDDIKKKMIKSFNTDRSPYTFGYDESVTYDENKNTPRGLLSREKLPRHEDQDIICKEQKSLFDRFLNKLTKLDLDIFMLKVDERLSDKDIGGIIDKSTSTARRYYRNIIKKLINYYIEMDYDTKATGIKNIYGLC